MNDEIDNELKHIYYEDLIILEAKIEKAREIAIKLLDNLDFRFIPKTNYVWKLVHKVIVLLWLISLLPLCLARAAILSFWIN